MRNKNLVITIGIILSIISTSCCITESEENVSLIALDSELSYDEISNINYSHVDKLLEKCGYNITTHLDEDYLPVANDYDLQARKYVNDIPELQISISARIIDNTTIGNLHVSYSPRNSFHQDPDNENYAVEYVEDSTIEVTQICNITLDINMCETSVEYGSGCC